MQPLQSLTRLAVEDLLALPPAVALSLVVSLDGQIGGPDRSARSISGPEDLRILRLLRAASDVIVVSARTAELERYPALRTHAEFVDGRLAAGLPRDPAVVILTRTGDVSRLQPELLAAANTTVLTTTDYPDAIRRVRDTYGERVLAEVGSTIIREHPGIHSRVWLSLAPAVVGNQGMALDIDLTQHHLAARYAGEQFVLQRFER